MAQTRALAGATGVTATASRSRVRGRHRLVLNEARVAQPIMPLHLFTDRERSGSYLTRFLYLGGMIGFFYFTTQLLQDGFGFTALQAGLAFLPMTAVNFVVALAVPRLSRRVSNAWLLTAGIAVTLVGMTWLSRVGAGDTYLVGVALPMILLGIGQGLAFAPMTSSGIARVDAAAAGAASGLLNTAHQLGMATGLGVLVSLAAGTGAEGPAAVFMHVGVALTGATCFIAAALLVVLIVLLPRRQQKAENS
ncbi:MFS transporter [Gordonia bronchialis]|uniref:MFS transporter n=1 Tax=Gordonia bronchialis TaxID=2054 RepID=UPI003119E4C7